MVETPAIENFKELQLYLDGKFALIAQTQEASSVDLKNVRQRVHDLSNEVAKLVALDIPGKISDLNTAIKVHDAELDKFGKDAAARKAVLAAVGIAGAAVGSVVTIVLELFKAFH